MGSSDAKPSMTPNRLILGSVTATVTLVLCAVACDRTGQDRESSLAPLQPSQAQAERIRRADHALSLDPKNVYLILEAAFAREDVWRYAEAVELYGRGLEIAPNDYRLYLGRAHRLIRLRQFDAALDDLDRAVELDPYGFNSAYLSGLAYYLTGRFDAAAEEYGRCTSLARDEAALALAETGRVPGDPRHCMFVATDPQSLVAITAWRYRALRRAGHHEEASHLLDLISEDLSLSEGGLPEYGASIIKPDNNEHYYHLILSYKGLKPERDLLDRERWGAQWSTVAYGTAVWHLVEGDTSRAMQLLREIVAEPYWARLGHVAAETDLIRLRRDP